MGVNSIVGVILALLVIIPSAFAYIDPGTGGYLISALWAWVTGAVAFVLAIVVHFFKYRLKNWWNKLSKKYKVVIVITPVILLASLSFFLFYNSKPVYALPDYDPAFVNVTINTDKAYDGYTLIEGKLLDMNGKVVHEWPYGHLGVIDAKGDYYAQHEYESSIWGKYSWNGSVIWEMELPIHHEILLTPQNTIIVLTKEVHDYNERKVEFDVIVEFYNNGTFKKRWSTWDHLDDLRKYHQKLELDTPPTSTLKEDTWKNTSIWGGNYDYYHTNAVSLVPNNSMQKTHPAFKPGNYLISFRHGSMVFIVDKDTGKIVWRAIHDQVKDNLEGPHAPKMFSTGNILIYDNGRYRGWTRLIIINPITLEVLWEYKDDDFFSYSQGFAQVLPNSNILVTESEIGRVFEIGKNKEIVWEWWNPKMFDDTSKPNYGKRQDVYRVVRYDKTFIDRFLK